MLLMFSFKNHGSFRDETTLDMRAITAYKEHARNYTTVNEQNILKVAEIHGANASGKSQFTEAYRDFRRMVVRSFLESTSDYYHTEDCYNPFLFTSNDNSDVTEYESVFIAEEGQYKYGFSYNADSIDMEWLYFVNAHTNRTTTVFERTGGQINFGASVRKECNKYADNIRKNVLVLSFMANVQLTTQLFSNTYKCVTDIIVISSRMCNADVTYSLKRYFRTNFDETEKERLLTFLQAIDTGIKDISVFNSERNIRVYTHHLGSDGNMYEAPIEIESSGTQKMIALYRYIRTAITRGRGLIIDELDAQIHPSLLKYIVDMFYETDTAGQLIFTAHSLLLLDRRFTRRDQVWIVDKDRYGQSNLYSLAEFKPRNDATLNVAYLGGRFGGIPNLEEIKKMEGLAHGD